MVCPFPEFRRLTVEHDRTLDNPPYRDRIIQLPTERQFELIHPRQLIHHASSFEDERDRTGKLAAHWALDFPLTDRLAIKLALRQMNIVDFDAAASIRDMEHI